MEASLRGAAARPDELPPEAVLQRLQEGLQRNTDAVVGADETLRLAEAMRVLALRHGPAAVRSLHRHGGGFASAARRDRRGETRP